VEIEATVQPNIRLAHLSDIAHGCDLVVCLMDGSRRMTKYQVGLSQAL